MPPAPDAVTIRCFPNRFPVHRRITKLYLSGLDRVADQAVEPAPFDVFDEEVPRNCEEVGQNFELAAPSRRGVPRFV